MTGTLITPCVRCSVIWSHRIGCLHKCWSNAPHDWCTWISIRWHTYRMAFCQHRKARAHKRGYKVQQHQSPTTTHYANHLFTPITKLWAWSDNKEHLDIASNASSSKTRQKKFAVRKLLKAQFWKICPVVKNTMLCQYIIVGRDMLQACGSWKALELLMQYANDFIASTRYNSTRLRHTASSSCWVEDSFVAATNSRPVIQNVIMLSISTSHEKRRILRRVGVSDHMKDAIFTARMTHFVDEWPTPPSSQHLRWPRQPRSLFLPAVRS